MNDIVIGSITGYDFDKIKPWVNSLDRSGFTGTKAMLCYNVSYETVDELVKRNYTILAFKKDEENKRFVYRDNFSIVVERFLHLWYLLKQYEGKYRYIVTTDVKDVIFQEDPTKYLGMELPGAKLMFASESMKYKDEPWGNQNLIETFGPFFHERFKDNTIYNVGVLAGRGEAMRDLCAMIFAMSVNRPIPIVDQSTFNFMISQEPYKSVARYMKSEDGWAAQLGTTADPSKINEFKPFLLEPSPIMKDGKVATSTGKDFTIVHQYDRVPEWKKVIEEKYND